jgi:hypothetical protein
MGRSLCWLGLTPALYTFGKMVGHSVRRKGTDEARLLLRTQAETAGHAIGTNSIDTKALELSCPAP